MCGRYTLRNPVEALAQLFGLPPLPGIGPRYNIAPSQPVIGVRDGGGAARADELRWGLVPSWADDPSIGYRMINARSETVADKPAYRDSFRSRRCLIPADGFYEWEKLDARTKQPWYVGMADDRPFAFAGVWDRWRSRDGATSFESCSVLTTTPNELVGPIHDRMPVILDGDALERWLDPGTGRESLRALCEPVPAERMRAVPVSSRVNDPGHDAPDCIEPVAAAPRTPSLFD